MAKKPYHLRHQPRKSSSTTTQAFTVIILLLFFLMILLGLGILSLPSTSRSSSRPVDLTTIVRDSEERESYANEDGNGDIWVEVISWEPRASLYHNFLTNEECEHLISLAKPSMKKSKVVDVQTGGSKDSRVRTSSGAFLRRGQDEIVGEIENRISDFTFIPVENGEGLQVLHYEVGQKYEPHHDYFSDNYNVKRGGNRIATVLMYLSDVEEGGETVFPAAKGNISDVPWWNELSQCGKEGLSVLPKKRDALLFWSARPDATLDPSSLHGGCPVIKGNKWSSTKWFHFNEYIV
ncbi:prolyl 4-hydroxylase 8 [Hirschfeldia incana]|nr:prolyl 4-hydroxylase 8 [Hirschfeldia incana]